LKGGLEQNFLPFVYILFDDIILSLARLLHFTFGLEACGTQSADSFFTQAMRLAQLDATPAFSRRSGFNPFLHQKPYKLH
jgi:hypothetical protein